MNFLNFIENIIIQNSKINILFYETEYWIFKNWKINNWFIKNWNSEIIIKNYVFILLINTINWIWNHVYKIILKLKQLLLKKKWNDVKIYIIWMKSIKLIFIEINYHFI